MSEQSDQRLIERLRSFSEAYPTDIFPELTAEEREALPRGIIDRISAGMGRHCAKIMIEAAEALERPGQRGEPK